MGLIYTGPEDAKRLPPADAQRELQEAFPDCFYEWMPNAGRWSVKRKISWDEADRLATAGLLSREDVEAHLRYRYVTGHFDEGDGMVIHAFTVRGPNGEYLEPGSYVVQAMKRADTQGQGKTVREALMETVQETMRREAELDRWYNDQVNQAVASYDPWLRQLPRMAYPNNPLGNDGNSTGNGSSGVGVGSEAGGAQGGQAPEGGSPCA